MNQLVLHLDDLTEEQAQWLEDTFARIEEMLSGFDLPQDDIDKALVRRWSSTTTIERGPDFNGLKRVTVWTESDSRAETGDNIRALIEVISVFVAEHYRKSLLIQWQRDSFGPVFGQSSLGGGAAFIEPDGTVQTMSTEQWLLEQNAKYQRERGVHVW